MPFLQGLEGFYALAGFTERDYFRSEQFGLLVAMAFGPDVAEQVGRQIASLPLGRESEGRAVQSAHVIGLVTDAFERLGGGDERSVWEISDRGVLGLLRSDPELMERIGVERASVQALQLAMDHGTQVVRMGRGKKDRRMDPAQQVHEIRARLDPVLRAQTVPTMRENFSAIDRQFEEEYGGPILPG